MRDTSFTIPRAWLVIALVLRTMAGVAQELPPAARVDDLMPGEMAAPVNLNGDGYTDLVRASSNQIRIVLGGRDGLVEADRASTDRRIFSIAAGKPDAAGALILVSNHVDYLEAREISPAGEIGDAFTLSAGGPPIHEVAFTSWGEGHGDRLLVVHGDGNARRRLLSLFEPVISGGFTRVTTFDVPGSQPVMADVDGDGHRDIILHARAGARVLRGSGSGFHPHLATIFMPWESVRTIAALDVEGDGMWELVAGETHPPEARLIDQGADEGQWNTVQLSSSSEINYLEAADLDGDGDTDVVADARYHMEVFHNGQGRLATPPEIVPGRGGYYTESPLAIADMDGDGRLDAVCNRTVTFGTAKGIGDHVDLAQLEGGDRPAIRAGDLNGDGNLDLIAFYEWYKAEVLLSTAGGGFVNATLPGQDTRAYGMEVADFDGDGNLDLAAFIVTQGHQWFRGRGDGAFDPPADMPGEIVILFHAADLDGDEASELLVVDPARGVLIHRGGASFATEAPDLLAEGIQSSAEAGLVDLDADGIEDLVLRGLDAQSRPVQQIFPGGHDGSLGAPITLDEPALLHPDSLFADLDDDGLADTVRIEQAMLFLVRGNGDFSFTSVPLHEMGEPFTPYELTDLNGDGRLDILGNADSRGDCIAMRKEDGTFEEPVFFAPMSRHFIDANGDGLKDALAYRYVNFRRGAIHAILGTPEHILEGSRDYPFLLGRAATGDFNDDGARDLALAADGSISIIAGDPQRRLRVAKEVLRPEGADREAFIFPGVGDYDGDGLDDLLLLIDGTVYGHRSLDDFSFEDPIILAENVPGYGISVADVDLDGTVDLLVSGFSVVRGLGGGDFDVPRVYLSADDWARPSVLGDFNADGIPDVAHSDGSRLITLSDGDGSGGFHAAEFLSSGADSLGGLSVGDFDGDGIADVSLGGHARPGIEDAGPLVYYGRRGKTFDRGDSLHDASGVDDGTLGLMAADWNRDGRDDLLSADLRGYLLAHIAGPEGLEDGEAVANLPAELAYFFAANFAGGDAVDVVAGGGGGLFLTSDTAPTDASFLRGDANADGRRNISDAMFALDYLFMGGAQILCMDSADANDDGVMDCSDPISLLGYLFLGSPTRLEEPWISCSADPTADELACTSSCE